MSRWFKVLLRWFGEKLTLLIVIGVAHDQTVVYAVLPLLCVT
jgi:hypothetical protein